MNPHVRFDKTSSANLLCPTCGNEYLHHDTVTVFERAREDAESRALVIECADNSSSATGSGRVYRPAESEQNPSERRGGVTIRFWCENCHSLSELALAQHKGCSVLAWRPAGHIVCHAE